MNMPVIAKAGRVAYAGRAAHATPVAGTTRYNIYRAIHRGLRAFMADTLVRIGNMDVDDTADMQDAVRQLDSLLALCRSHLEHENRFVHPAMERAVPDSALETADDHVEHLEAIESLEDLMATLTAVRPDERAETAQLLYLALARFVADNFLHMHTEETANQAVLVAAYGDAELQAIEGQIRAQIPPDETLLTYRWIIAAITPADRLRAFREARDHAPPPVFAALMQVARQVLGERDRNKLESGLQQA